MSERVLEFINEYFHLILGIGIGFGCLIGCITALLGYAINKIQSFFDQ